METCVLGIDGGTGSLRAGLYDVSGRKLGYAVAEYPTHYPRDGWAEQDPGDWERALVTAIREVLKKTGVPPSSVAGIGADATIGTLVLMDRVMTAMGRCLLWMDVRAGRELAALRDIGHPAMAVNPTAEWPLPKMMWVAAHEPERYRRTHRVMEYTGWLMHRLTGRDAAPLSNAACRWMYDAARGGYPRDLFEAAGLPGLIGKLPPETLPAGTLCGGLTDEMARVTGLTAGTPVAAGSPDGIAAMIGLNAYRPGSAAMICGTSHVHVAVTDREIRAPGIIGSYPDAILPGCHILEGGQTTTGAVLTWYRDRFLESYRAAAEGEGLSLYAYMDRLAADVPPGSEGLMMLETFQGSRTPYRDPLARGALWGLSLRHTPVHIYRAVLEAVAYGTRQIFDILRERGVSIGAVTACGGMTRSPLWLHIHADVTGLPIRVTRDQDASLLGSAVMAARAAGLYDSLPDASAAMVAGSADILPDPTRHLRYEGLYALYRDTYPAMAPLMARMHTLMEE